MIEAISRLNGASRQIALYERYFLPKFRPAPLPQIPELSDATRARLRLAAQANSALLRVQGELIRSNTAHSLAAAGG